METIKTNLHPNCTKFEVDLKNKTLIQYFEPDKGEFKRGDYVSYDDRVCIFSHYSGENGFISIANNSFMSELGWCNKLFNLASKEQITEMDNYLLEHGYIFNKTTLELEKVHRFQQGDAVLVRDKDNESWLPSVFRSYNSNDEMYKYSGYGSAWAQCILFDPELVGTTNKPKL